MTINKKEKTINLNGISFTYTIEEAFSKGSAKCLSVQRTNEGIKKLPVNSPIIKSLFNEIKKNEFFKSEVNVDVLMILTHREFIGRYDALIMSDLAKI